MTENQFRAIRNSFQRDVIYCVGTEYRNDLLAAPIMRKTISEIRLHGKKIKSIYKSISVTKDNNEYILYCLDWGHTSRTLYVITLNGRIIYFRPDSILLSAIDAFHALTEVYHGYDSDSGNWKWRSVEPFIARNHYSDETHMDILTELITPEEQKELDSKIYYHL